MARIGYSIQGLLAKVNGAVWLVCRESLCTVYMEVKLHLLLVFVDFRLKRDMDRKDEMMDSKIAQYLSETCVLFDDEFSQCADTYDVVSLHPPQHTHTLTNVCLSHHSLTHIHTHKCILSLLLSPCTHIHTHTQTCTLTHTHGCAGNTFEVRSVALTIV